MTLYAETCEITVSGPIPHGPTTHQITYFVVDPARNAVVGTLVLPDAATFAQAFRLKVRVPQGAEHLEVGLFEETGFVSAGFTVEAPARAPRPAGAVG